MDTFVTELQTGRRLPNDPFFAEGNAFFRAGEIEPVFDIDDEELCHKTFELLANFLMRIPAFPCDVAGCQQTFTLVYEYEQHYNSAHRYTCKECRKTLPSPHLLDLHIMENHDTYFAVLSERKPMYQCYIEECIKKFSDPKERRSHCIEVHKFPSDFRYDGVRKAKGEKCKHVAPQHVKKKVNIENIKSEILEVEGCKGDDTISLQPKIHPAKIPKGFTFGHNQERTFLGAKSRGRGKHWYQKKLQEPLEKTVTQDMPHLEELMDSLPTESS